MKLAHLSDLHLGFRQYARTNPKGANTREADVAATLTRAVTDIIAAAPEAVVIAGDVFHSVRPSNAAILHLFKALQRLRESLPGTAVLMIAGDHDTPRSSESASILGLYRALGVIVHQGPTLLHYAHAGTDFLLCPSGAAPELNKGRAIRAGTVLVAHAENGDYGREIPTRQDIAPHVLNWEHWGYVALGHHHVRKQVGPRAWYAGSLDFVSSDPWHELTERKGWLLVDTNTGEVQPHYVPTRIFLDLGPYDAGSMSAEQIEQHIDATLRLNAPDNAVVRYRFTNVSLETRRAIRFELIRPHRERLLHLQLEFARPEGGADSVAAYERRQEMHRRLDEVLDDFLGTRELPPDVDRAELRQLGADYFRRAGQPTDDQ